jgi:magnesium transporter
MLFAYSLRGNSLERTAVEAGRAPPDGVPWFDLIVPTPEEERAIEAKLGLEVPTREEMAEIEPSSRLYIENGVRYMTATLVYNAETDNPKTTVVTFILVSGTLVTVRYDEPRPFARVSAKLGRVCPPGITGEAVLLELLDAVIDRAADILERAGADIDQVSRRIFERGAARDDPNQRYQGLLRTIGRKGDLTSKTRESLVSIGRLVLFFANDADNLRLGKDQRAQLRSMARDVQSLTDHASFLINKIQFLLDAVVGMVSMEQNNVIKIFSVVAVVMMPPTLIASIYGMNFRHMPELEWILGYPLALILMIIAGVAPLLYFRWKRWL